MNARTRAVLLHSLKCCVASALDTQRFTITGVHGIVPPDPWLRRYNNG
jgi:hypothetical protein